MPAESLSGQNAVAPPSGGEPRAAVAVLLERVTGFR